MLIHATRDFASKKDAVAALNRDDEFVGAGRRGIVGTPCVRLSRMRRDVPRVQIGNMKGGKSWVVKLVRDSNGRLVAR